MQLLKQSTAATVLVGPVLDSAGLAITTAVIGDFQLTKNGSSAALASPATATHSHNGNYLIALSTGNTDTAGRLVITVNNAAQAMGTHRYTVLVASVFDAIVTNATNTTGGLPTATGAITALAGAVSTLTAGGVRTELATELGRIDATIGSRATQTSVDTIDDFIDTEVLAIKNKTDLIVAFPDNFGSLEITAGGAIAELGANALTANGAVDAIPTVVWNALTTTSWTAGSFGQLVLISKSTNRGVTVIGAESGHIASVVHGFEAGVITSAAFSANWLTAAGLASDAATEIATAVAATQALSRLDSMIESDGAGQFRFDTIAVSMAPAGGGGGNQTINVYPVSASTPERVAGTTITYYRNEIRSVSVVTDFTLTNLTLSFTVEDAEGTDLLTIPNGSITRSNQTFTVSIGTAATSSTGNKRWALRDITGGTNSVIARGVFSVQEAASA